jgi:hypothetical protein
LAGRTRFKALGPGTLIEGNLARSVYWRDVEVLAKGSKVRLVLDQVESQKKSSTVDDRPFFVHLFAPRRDLIARFRSVKVLMPDGSQVALQATVIALGQRAELTAQVGKRAPTAGKRPPRSLSPLTLTLKARPVGTTFQALAEARTRNQTPVAASCPDPCSVADGTRMPLVLLDGLSASKNFQGQSFRAVLLEPVHVGATAVLPQGAMVEGTVAKRIPPRRLYRPGSLYLQFNHLSLPGRPAIAIVASPAAAEVDEGSHMKMDSEGIIHAQSPGTARFLLDFGVTGGISKIGDDTTQLIIEAISSSATDASTAGAARFAAMGASAIFLLTRHGRDVILPPFTQMDITLSRAVSLGTELPASAVAKQSKPD